MAQVNGKAVIRYLRFLKLRPNKNRALRELITSRHKEAHDYALEKGYIVNIVTYREYKNVWRLTKDGHALLRQMRGDFSKPKLRVDWSTESTLRGRLESTW